MSQVLEAGTKVIDNSLTLEQHPSGYRIVRRGGIPVCLDSGDDLIRCSRFVLDIHRLSPDARTIAHIGGGLCVTARLLGPHFTHTIFEIEPALSAFAPEGAKFIPGDWRETISGKFDVIVFDLGCEVPTHSLSRFLAPEGRVIS